MNLRSAVAVLLTIMAEGCGTAPTYPPLSTVGAVDLQRYLGVWYEIGRLPNSFEKECVAVTATYASRPDGKIDVLNQCRRKTFDGPIKKARGKAWVVDSATNAKLKVQFFFPFSGDYWILELGSDYDYAVVGTPDRKLLWILCREPRMNETLYQGILERRKQQGFDVGRMIRTPQS